MIDISKVMNLAVHPLRDDLDLIKAVEMEMRFVEDPELMEQKYGSMIAELGIDEKKLELIQYFEEAYGNTDQDTVTYGPEFVIVVRNILQGKRPVKLRFLTDFNGEVK